MTVTVTVSGVRSLTWGLRGREGREVLKCGNSKVLELGRERQPWACFAKQKVETLQNGKWKRCKKGDCDDYPISNVVGVDNIQSVGIGWCCYTVGVNLIKLAPDMERFGSSGTKKQQRSIRGRTGNMRCRGASVRREYGKIPRPATAVPLLPLQDSQRKSGF